MQHELQQAYAQSRDEAHLHGAKVGNEIARLLAEGKFVVAESPDYCPRTDAVIGTQRTLISWRWNREVAEGEVARLYDGEDDECRYLVLPLLPRPATVPVVGFDDDIPF